MLYAIQTGGPPLGGQVAPLARGCEVSMLEMLEEIFSQTILLTGAAVYGWLINTLMKQCYESNTPFRSSRRQLVQATLLFHVAMFCWIQFSMNTQLWTMAAVHAGALLATVVSGFLLVWRYRRQGVLKRKRKHSKPQEVWKDSWQISWTPDNLPLHSHREHSTHGRECMQQPPANPLLARTP